MATRHDRVRAYYSSFDEWSHTEVVDGREQVTQRGGSPPGQTEGPDPLPAKAEEAAGTPRRILRFAGFFRLTLGENQSAL